MPRSLSTLSVISLLFALGACTHREQQMSSASYDESIRAWQKHRDAGLRSPDGWLTLVGLFWLKPGANTIGSAENNDCVLPKTAPAHVGTLDWKGGQVLFTAPGQKPRTLSFDDDNPDVIHAGTVSFFVMKRLDKFVVRAKDSQSPVLKNFKGMSYFPIDAGLHFREANLIPDPKKVPILNIVGQTEMEDSPGVVEFTYGGKTYHLRPIYEGKTLFFLYKDPTNKTDTYQAGRMLNTPLPKNGVVDLDFNRSYNPPCTFTPYATCPLPPKENTLTFPVTAGEKRYGSGHPEGYGNT
jgi:uncharacterized protein (DUF1684 family)